MFIRTRWVGWLLGGALLALATQNDAWATVGVAACELPPAVQPVAVEPDGAPNVLPVFDYVLALSWSPQHCRSKGGTNAASGPHAHQCFHNSFEWVVHGLWPQSKDGVGKLGQPRNCKGPQAPLPAEVVRQQLCTMPGVRLVQHQWQAHGACGWDTPTDYFSRVNALAARFQLPSFSSMSSSPRMTVSALKDLIVGLNPGALSPEHLMVTVGSKNALAEVFVCLDLAFEPTRCRSTRSTPDSQIITVLAPRASEARGPTEAPVATSAQRVPQASASRHQQEVACPTGQRQFAGYAKAAKSAFWNSLYPDGGRTIYCDAAFADRLTQGGLDVSIEHALPQSRLRAASGKGDLHNLWPSIATVNSARSSYVLVDNIPEENWAYQGSPQAELRRCDFEVQTLRRPDRQRTTVVEPREGARGPLARSILHMAMAYGVSLSPQERATYLTWHRTYGITADEERRNDVIEVLQGTRNPLIDSPQSADVLLRACLR